MLFVVVVSFRLLIFLLMYVRRVISLEKFA